ncbi:hypothetical protein BSR03_23145 [Serratia proteamaculans]|nr:hypothetical protein BSR03_23145 [Serratia proteamaculans]
MNKTQLSGVSGFAFRRCRRLISPLAATIKKPAMLSPSSFNLSISSKSSRGSLTETCRERLFFLPVAIAVTPCVRWCSVYTRKMILKHLKWCSLGYTLVVFTLSTGKAQSVHKIATPRSAGTLPRRLTTNDRISIEAAMSNITTAPQRFTFLFLAVVRANPQAHPHREQITAISEREARSLLAGRFVLVFAGRLPVLGEIHA